MGYDLVIPSYYQVQEQKQQYDAEEKGADFQCTSDLNQNNIFPQQMLKEYSSPKQDQV